LNNLHASPGPAGSNESLSSLDGRPQGERNKQIKKRGSKVAMGAEGIFLALLLFSHGESLMRYPGAHENGLTARAGSKDYISKDKSNTAMTTSLLGDRWGLFCIVYARVVPSLLRWHTCRR
jgi:hypothetical protein